MLVIPIHGDLSEIGELELFTTLPFAISRDAFHTSRLRQSVTWPGTQVLKKTVKLRRLFPVTLRPPFRFSFFPLFPSPSTNPRSEEHTSELQSLAYLVCRLLLEKKKITINHITSKS